MYEAISRNKWRSFFLVFLVSALLLTLGYFLGAAYIGKGMGAIGGLGIAGIIAIVMGLLSYYKSDSIILWISRARPVRREECTDLWYAIESLSVAAGIPAPRAFIIDDSAPNAFATGRNPETGVICVTTGLLQKLDRVELEGVVAHEIAHIRNHDMMFMSMVVIMVGAIALISDVALRYMFWGGHGRSRSRSSGDGGGGLMMVIALVLAIVAPIVAMLLQLAVSRRRELLADATAALITRYPEGLASALRKLEADHEPLEVANKATAHLYIVNPLKQHGGGVNKLFSTHPALRERIEALAKM